MEQRREVRERLYQFPLEFAGLNMYLSDLVATTFEPNNVQAFSNALVFAEQGKDSQAMQWAVGEIISKDWPLENEDLHKQARTRLNTLAYNLGQESRTKEADKLKLALQTLSQRDFVVQLTWENAPGELAELELMVKEPCGSTCSAER